MKRTSHGMILGENNEKMSKSRGNVINPDDVVAEIGADAFRVYEMFMGAFDQAIPWSTRGAKGCYRFLERVWKLQNMLTEEEDISEALKASVHATIKKVSEDYERMKFNTAIAAMMSLVNEIYEKGSLSRGDLHMLILLLNPAAPHITEEIRELQNLGTDPLYKQSWPSYDESALVKDSVEIAIQINGKVKGRIDVPTAYGKEQIEKLVMEDSKVQAMLEGKTIRKLIVVPGRIINIVVS